MIIDPFTYVKLLTHRGHNVSLATYGATDENVWLECEDCGVVILGEDLDINRALLAEIDALQEAGAL